MQPYPHKIHPYKPFAPTGNKRSRKRRFGAALERHRRLVNTSDLPRDERSIEYLSGKHDLRLRIRPSSVPIMMRGTFSREAKAAVEAFFDYKRRHPRKIPYHEMTPLQKRMQSGFGSALLSAWVDREVEKDRAIYDAMSPEEKDRALAGILRAAFSPVQYVIDGGKK